MDLKEEEKKTTENSFCIAWGWWWCTAKSYKNIRLKLCKYTTVNVAH